MYKRVDLEDSVVLHYEKDGEPQKIHINTQDLSYYSTSGNITHEEHQIVGEILHEFTLDGVLERYGFEKVVDKEFQEIWVHDDWFGKRINLDIDGSEVGLFVEGWGTLPLGDYKLWKQFWRHLERRYPAAELDEEV